MTGDPSSFDPDEVIKRVAHIILERGDDTVRKIQGVVTQCSLSAAITGVPKVSMVIEPRLGLLAWRRDIRIHRDLTVPEIVHEVVAALGVTCESRLTSSYPKRPYCVQHRETDLDYVDRLLQDEGIYYYFAPGDVMVLGDSPSGYQSIDGDPVLPFRAAAGMNLNDDAVHQLGSRASLTAGKVTLRDWNSEHANADMDVSHPTQSDSNSEWYDYPGEYVEPTEGRRKAKLHAEALDRQAAAMLGASTSGRIYPGSTFVLRGAPAVGRKAHVRLCRSIWASERLSACSMGMVAVLQSTPSTWSCA